MSDITGSLNSVVRPTSQRSMGFWQVLKRAVFGGLLAVAANLLVFAAARFIISLPLIMPPNPGLPEPAPLNAVAVGLATFVPAIGAGVVYWLLGKLTKNPRRNFLIVSILFLLVSFGGPFTLPIELSTMLTLSLMHIVAGAAIVGALTR